MNDVKKCGLQKLNGHNEKKNMLKTIFTRKRTKTKNRCSPRMLVDCGEEHRLGGVLKPKPVGLACEISSGGKAVFRTTSREKKKKRRKKIKKNPKRNQISRKQKKTKADTRMKSSAHAKASPPICLSLWIRKINAMISRPGQRESR